jgi:hypothetical protein
MSAAPAKSRTEQFGKGDLGILNYALTLEYLETAFYADVIKSGLFKGSDLETIKTFGSQEAQHRRGADRRRSSRPAARRRRSRRPSSRSTARKSVLKLAGTVENLGAAAYLGQAPEHPEPRGARLGLAIHSVEGRHASALNTLLGQPITPDGAFAKPPTRTPSSSRCSRSSSAEPASNEKGNAMRDQEPDPSELAGVHVEDESGDLSRSEVILKGGPGGRRRLRRRAGRPFVRQALAIVGRWRPRDPQLRPHPGVPGDGLLQGGEVPGEGERGPDVADQPDRPGRGRARERPQRDDHAARRQAGRGAEGGVPLQGHGRLPEARADFEDTGVSAYNGAAPAIKSKDLLATAGAIVQVEARHAAAIRLQNSAPPAPRRSTRASARARC